MIFKGFEILSISFFKLEGRKIPDGIFLKIPTPDIAPETRTGDIEIDGLTSLADLFNETGIELPEGPYKTASGFIMHFLGRMPRLNDVVNINGIRLVVLSLEGHRVGQILISRAIAR